VWGFFEEDWVEEKGWVGMGAREYSTGGDLSTWVHAVNDFSTSGAINEILAQ
jgi:hypothetical protein